jgi:hypothetical protein
MQRAELSSLFGAKTKIRRIALKVNLLDIQIAKKEGLTAARKIVNKLVV